MPFILLQCRSFHYNAIRFMRYKVIAHKVIIRLVQWRSQD